jgi:hypothetical protein
MRLGNFEARNQGFPDGIRSAVGVVIAKKKKGGEKK